MQLNALAAAQLATVSTATAGVPARVVAGDLARVPVGELLEATVTAATPRDATLTVSGRALTVQLPPGAPLQQGAVLLLRVPPGAATAPHPTVELSVPPSVSAPASQPLPNVPRGSSQPSAAVVDVLDALPDGRSRVRIDGQEQVARPAEPLVPGERYVLHVERAATGVALKPLPPDAPATAREVATAILRVPAADVGTALKPLRAELETLTAPPAKGEPPAPPAVRAAATAVRDALEALVPQTGRAPDAAQLQRFVEHGGQLFEAKLARAAEGAPAVPTPAKPATGEAPANAPLPALAPKVPNRGVPANAPAGLLEALAARPAPASPDVPVPQPTATERPAAVGPEAPEVDPRGQPVPREPTSPGRTREAPAEVRGETREPVPDARAEVRPEPREAAPDLKGELLKLLRAANDIGNSVRVPAVEAALHTIESQQAANALAQANGTAFHLQIPFPDGDRWRTVRLALEPERRADSDPRDPRDPASRFRVFMHVPLTELGETYIEAGLSGGSFRATIYLDAPDVRARVGNELDALRTELEAEGFTEVLLDVRAASDLPDRRRRAGELRAGRSDGASVLDVRA